MGTDKENVASEYNSLKQHRDCMEEMIVELDFRVQGLRAKAVENKEKPNLVHNYLAAAKYAQKRLDALKAIMPLVDAELLHYLQVMK